MARTYIMRTNRGKQANDSYDVFLNVRKNGMRTQSGEQSYVVSLIFKNGSKEKATTTDYVLISYDDELDRMYFEDGSSIGGFKVSKRSGSRSANVYTAFTIRDTDFWKLRIGNYNLMFDKSEKLYYIDFSKRTKKDLG